MYVCIMYVFTWLNQLDQVQKLAFKMLFRDFKYYISVSEWMSRKYSFLYEKKWDGSSPHKFW